MTTSFGSRTALISLLLLAACPACGDVEHPCIEDTRTITRGIYGQARFVGQSDKEPLKDIDVSITSGLGYIDMRTDDDGLFEAALPAGYYSVCSDFLMVGCLYISTADDDLNRIDLQVDEGVEAYWYTAPVGSCP